jgi:hypothetical protein
LVSSCTTAPSSGRRSTSRGRPGDRVGEADDAGLGVRFDGPSPAGSPGEARHQAGGEQQRDRDHLGDRVDPQGVVGSGQEEVVGQGGRECRDEPGGPATDARNVTPAGPWGPCRPAGPWLPRSRARALAEMSTTAIERSWIARDETPPERSADAPTASARTFARADAVARRTKRGVAGPAERNNEREACDDVGVGQPAADASEHSISGQPHALGVRPS